MEGSNSNFKSKLNFWKALDANTAVKAEKPAAKGVDATLQVAPIRSLDKPPS